MPERSAAVARLAWSTLAVNFFVILWGAWVRASGSGAGCGNHWPTCNGSIIPSSPGVHTLIEFTHRFSTGVALALVVMLVLRTRRDFARGHRTRRAAMAALVLLFVEAGIGAGLVKLDLVADNATLARGLALGVHLVNTQFLLTAIALTGWWAASDAPTDRARLRRWRWPVIAGFAALVVVGMSGAIASLGDTLFPAHSLAQGLAQDRGATSSVLLHIRVWHPVFAILAGSGLLWIASSTRRQDERIGRPARRLIAAVLAQWCIGLLSLVLLVPVALQLLHLLAADLVWLALAGLAVSEFAGQPERTTLETSWAASASNSVPAPSSR